MLEEVHGLGFCGWSEKCLWKPKSPFFKATWALVLLEHFNLKIRMLILSDRGSYKDYYMKIMLEEV